MKRVGNSILTAMMTSLCLALSLLAPGAFAQTIYPTRTLQIVVGFAGGTPPDIVARILGDKLAESLRKPIVVENVAGASGNIAGGRVAKAEPDGSTLYLAANSAIVINPSLYHKMSFDPVAELAPITQVCSYANILVVNKDVPVTNVQQLIALARAQPGTLTYGTPGAGTTVHLSGELFRAMANIEIQHIPFRNSILPDLLGGRITMAFLPPANVLPLVREGKLRALAVTSLTRIASAPDIPTMDELGFPGYDITVWYGLMAPAKTPAAIIDRLYSESTRILALPEIRTRFAEIGTEVIGNTPQEFAEVIKAETPRWAKFINNLGLKLD